MLAFRRCLVSSSLKESGLTTRNAARILKDALAHRRRTRHRHSGGDRQALPAWLITEW